MNPYTYQCQELASGPPGNRSLVPRNITQRQYPPTHFNDCLDADQAIWDRIRRCGGLMSICPGKKYTDPPWVKMPQQGKRFSPIGSIPLPTTYNTDILVLSFRVPLGYDGVIKYVVENYAGQGFSEGSGDLIWRISLNQRFVKNYGNTNVQLGSLVAGPSIPNSEIILLSNQLVQFWINVAPAAAGDLNGGRVLAAAFGWWWPR